MSPIVSISPVATTPVRSRRVEHVLARQALHLDQPVERAPGSAKAQSARRIPAQRHGSQIGVGGEPAVQPQFLLAGEAALGDGAEVEEIVTDRLLELVDAVRGQEEPRHVRLDDVDRRAAMG